MCLENRYTLYTENLTNLIALVVVSVSEKVFVDTLSDIILSLSHALYSRQQVPQ